MIRGSTGTGARCWALCYFGVANKHHKQIKGPLHYRVILCEEDKPVILMSLYIHPHACLGKQTHRQNKARQMHTHTHAYEDIYTYTQSYICIIHTHGQRLTNTDVLTKTYIKVYRQYRQTYIQTVYKYRQTHTHTLDSISS